LVETKQTAFKLRLNAMEDKYAKNGVCILSGPNIKMGFFLSLIKPHTRRNIGT